MLRLRTAEQFAAVLNASKLRKQAKHHGQHRSAHFVLHVTGSLASAQAKVGVTVDGLLTEERQESQLQQTTLGIICPKRWAKRAVTRNLIKRQIYAVSEQLSDRLPRAYLVVRQHAAFAPEQFRSASSPALKKAVRMELQQLFARVLREEQAA
ncbi:MAG: ribonuclease P protein component [Brachymonas sp.]|nr:ribonuclease P protein component [Brachymonas sp.]